MTLGLSIGLLCSSAPAAAYSTHAEISATRTLSATSVAPGQSVTVTIELIVGSMGTDPLRGLVITDHIPQLLTLSDATVQVDGSGVTVLQETTSVGQVYAGCRSRRVVLETPPSWSEGRAVAAASTVTMSYVATVPAATNPGDLTLPGFTFFGMIAAHADAGDHFGYEDAAQTITVISVGDDDDNDGMPNTWEDAHGLDRADAADAGWDDDLDRLSNLQEFLQNTDPQVADSDTDGAPDGWEVFSSFNPLLDDSGEDADGDGATNLAEYSADTDPRNDASAPTGADVLFDDFADGDALNPDWEAWAGSWAVSGELFEQTSGTDNSLAAAGDVSWDDYTLTAVMQLEGAQTQGSGLLFRATDENNLYLFEVNTDSNEGVLWKRDAGTFSELGRGTAANPILPFGWYAVRVEAIGAQLRVLVNNQVIVSANDATHTTGKVGLNAGDTARFDDVRVTLEPVQTENQSPIATAVAATTRGEAPLDVQFTGIGADTDGTIAGYTWTFGDGDSSDEQNPTHVFTEPGSYSATLTVQDNEGATGSQSVSILVYEPGTEPMATERAPLVAGGCGCSQTADCGWLGLAAAWFILRRRRDGRA